VEDGLLRLVSYGERGRIRTCDPCLKRAGRRGGSVRFQSDRQYASRVESGYITPVGNLCATTCATLYFIVKVAVFRWGVTVRKE